MRYSAVSINDPSYGRFAPSVFLTQIHVLHQILCGSVLSPWRHLACRNVGLPLTLALVVLAGVCRAADAPKPEVKSESVLGVPVGKTTTVVLYGENLAPKFVTIKSPLTVKLIDAKPTDEKTKSKGSRQVTLEVTVPPACPRETYELTLTQPDNTTAKANLCVTEETAMEVPIKKPSATFANAMPLPGPSTAVTGQMDGDSADVVRFDAKAGEVWEISLLSSRAGSMMDPVLRVRDSRHMSMALSVGDKKKDRHIKFHVPADGSYYVEITEAEAKGGAGYTYRLAVVRKP